MGKKRADRGEQKIFHSLPFKEKVRYILDYYWLWILGIGCALAFVIFVINRLFFVPGDYWIYGMFANTRAEVGNESQLWKDFRDYAGFDTSEKNMEFTTGYWFDPSVKNGTNNSYFETYAAISDAGDLDFLVMEREGLEALGASGRLLDLNMTATDEASTGQLSTEEGANAAPPNTPLLTTLAQLREEYGDRFVYVLPLDETYSAEPVPIGIDISDSILMTEYVIYPDSCVLGINAYTKRPEAVITFLKFVLGDTDQAEEAQHGEA